MFTQCSYLVGSLAGNSFSQNCVKKKHCQSYRTSGGACEVISSSYVPQACQAFFHTVLAKVVSSKPALKEH